MQQGPVDVHGGLVQLVEPLTRLVLNHDLGLLLAQVLDDAPQVFLVLLGLGDEFVVLRTQLVVLDGLDFGVVDVLYDLGAQVHVEVLQADLALLVALSAGLGQLAQLLGLGLDHLLVELVHGHDAVRVGGHNQVVNEVHAHVGDVPVLAVHGQLHVVVLVAHHAEDHAAVAGALEHVLVRV